MKINPALRFVKEVRKTRSLEEMAKLMETGDWLCIACAYDNKSSGYLFVLGKVL